jgi:uncharacterized protein YndB with AHSA1/START domain/DNA-binding transcriptional ArsR family regulator
MAAPSTDVFRALADPSRRHLLDLLRDRDGRTLGELAVQLTMARQSATQHLAVLESANLVSVVWRGRQKLHYLNPVPLQDIQERWISRFERPRLQVLSETRRRAEENAMQDSGTGGEQTDRPTFSYTTYIEATAERVWQALTDADVTATFWGHSNVSDWQVGSRWEHRRTDGSGIADVVGTVLESDPPRRLVITFAGPGEAPAEDSSVVTFTLEPFHEIVKLTVRQDRLPTPGDYEAAAVGWSSVMSNLKTLLETGSVLSTAPWEMHADLRVAQMARNDPR